MNMNYVWRETEREKCVRDRETMRKIIIHKYIYYSFFRCSAVHFLSKRKYIWFPTRNLLYVFATMQWGLSLFFLPKLLSRTINGRKHVVAVFGGEGRRNHSLRRFLSWSIKLGDMIRRAWIAPSQLIIHYLQHSRREPSTQGTWNRRACKWLCILINVSGIASIKHRHSQKHTLHVRSFSQTDLLLFAASHMGFHLL